jgi:hypothetical protein
MGLVYGLSGPCLVPDVCGDGMTAYLGGDTTGPLAINVNDRNAGARSGQHERQQPTASVATTDYEGRLVFQTEDVAHVDRSVLPYRDRPTMRPEQRLLPQVEH